jgi:hypothetical protein
VVVVVLAATPEHGGEHGRQLRRCPAVVNALPEMAPSQYGTSSTTNGTYIAADI